MNKIFRVVFNAATGTWVAVSELVKSQGKTKTESRAKTAKGLGTKTIVLTGIAMACLYGQDAFAYRGCLEPAGTGYSNDGATAGAGGSNISGTIQCGNVSSDTYIVAAAYDGISIGINSGSYSYLGTGNSDYPAPVAVGINATAMGNGDVAVGDDAYVRDDSSVTGTGTSSIGRTGHGQQTGVGSNLTIIGEQSLGLGADVLALGNSTIAIGGDDVRVALSDLKTEFPDIATADGAANVSSVKYYVEQMMANSGYSKTAKDKVNSTGALSRVTGDATAETTAEFSPTAALGEASTAIGEMAYAVGTTSVALGTVSEAVGNVSIATGTLAYAMGDRSVAVGSGVWAQGVNAVAVGSDAQAAGNNATAFGSGALAMAQNAISIGSTTVVGSDENKTNHTLSSDTLSATDSEGYNSIAIGVGSNVTGKSSIILGNNVTESTDSSVILGANSTQTGSDPIQSTTEGVATGTLVLTRNDDGTANQTFDYSYHYGDFAGATNVDGGDYVSVGSSTGSQRKIINVAAGAVNSNSTELVNGSELYAVAQELQTIATPVVEAGDGVKVDTKTVTNDDGTSYKVYTVSLASTATSTGDGDNSYTVGNISYNASTGKVDVPTDTTTVPTSKSVADAINASGFNVSTGTSTVETINPGDTLTLQAGKNVDITQSGKTFTIATSQTPTFEWVNVTGTGIDMNNTVISNVASSIGDVTDYTNLPSDVQDHIVNVGDIQNWYNTTVNSLTANSAKVEPLDSSAEVDANTDGSQYSVSERVNSQVVTEEKFTKITSGELVDGIIYVGGAALDSTFVSAPVFESVFNEAYFSTNASNAGGGTVSGSTDKANITAGGVISLTSSDGSMTLSQKNSTETQDVTHDVITTNEDGTTTNSTKTVSETYNVSTVSFGIDEPEITVGDSDGKNGTLTVTGIDGGNVTITGANGTIGMTGPQGDDGSDGVSSNLSITGQGDPGVDGEAGTTKTRIVYGDDPSGDPSKATQVATLNDGLKFVGDDGKTVTRKLNQTLTLKGDSDGANVSGSNIYVSAFTDANNASVSGLEIELASNLTDLNSATWGSGTTKTVVNDGGMTITNGDNTVSLTSDSLNNGGNQVTNVASALGDQDIRNVTDSDTLNSGVTIGDLKNTYDELSKENTNTTINIATDKTGTGSNGKASDGSDVAPQSVELDLNKAGSQVTYLAGDNMVIAQNGKDFTFAVSDDIVLGSQGSDGANGTDGSVTVNGADSGSSVGLNGSDGSIGFTGKDGTDGTTTTSNLSVAQGDPGVDGTNGTTRLVYGPDLTNPEQIATLNDGMVFAGNQGSVNASLNSTLANNTVSIVGGADKDKTTTANNTYVSVDSTTDTLTVEMNKDLTDLTSATFGDTTTNKDGSVISGDGLTITNGDATVSLTDDGLDNGDNQIVNVASGLDGKKLADFTEDNPATQTNVVNIGDLQRNLTDYTKVSNKGGYGFTTDEEGTSVTKDLGDNVDIVGDGSIVTSVSDGKIKVSLNNTVSLGSTKGEDGTGGSNGSLTVNGKDGSGVAIDGANGTIGLTGPKGDDGQPGTNITVVQGKPGLDGKDGETKTRISYGNDPTNPDADGTEQVATLNDGFHYNGNTGDTIDKYLNEQLTITGSAGDEQDAVANNASLAASDENTYVVADNTTQSLTVEMNKNLTGLVNATFGDTTSKDYTVIGGNGLTITNGDKTVTLTSSGLDNGDNQIVNVSSGLDGKKLSDFTGDDQPTLTNVVNIGDIKTNLDDLVKAGTTGGYGFTTDEEGTSITKDLGNNVDIIGDGSIVTSVSDGKIKVSLNNTVSLGSTKGEDGTGGSNGSLTVNGKDGSGVAIDGANGTIGLTGPKGDDGQPGTNITVVQGKPGLDGKDGETKTRISYGDDPTNPDADGTEQVATLNDGFHYNGNTGDTISKYLNEQLTITGSAGDEQDAVANNASLATSDENTYVVADNATQSLTVEMSKNLTGLVNATFGDTTSTDKTVIGDNGVTITNGGNTVSLTSSGLDNGNNQIVNVSSGLDGKKLSDFTGDDQPTLTNVVNIGDLQNTINDLANNASYAGFGFTADDGKSATQTLGNAIDVVGDDSVVTMVTDDGQIKVSLNNTVTIGQPNSNDAEDGEDGTLTVNGANGNNVVIDGANGTIGLNVDSTNPTTGTYITVGQGDHGLGETASKTRLTYTTPNATDSTQVDTEQLATTNDGFQFSGNTGDTIDKKLNQTLTITGSASDATDAVANNDNATTDQNTYVNVDASTDTMTVEMTKDLTDLNSVTFGNDSTDQTVIDQGGVTITNGDSNVSLTKEGLDNGGNQIINVASGLEGKNLSDINEGDEEWNNVANIGDLQDALTDISNTATDGGYGFTTDDGKNVTQSVGGSIDIVGDGSAISTSVDDGKIKVSLGDNITVGSNGQDGKDAANGTVTINGQDGAGVAINGANGTIGLTGAKGEDGQPGTTLTVAEGAPGLDGTDGKTRIVYGDDPTNTQDGSNTQQVATMDDGFHFEGNTGDTISKKLNQTLTITGSTGTGLSSTADVTSQNTRVDSENGQLVVKMAKNLSDLDSATFGDGKQQTVVTDTGITVSDGKTTVSMNDHGIDNGGNQLKNVDSDSSNVATVADLQQLVNSGADMSQGIQALNGDLSRLEKDNDAGSATAGAMANLPQAYLPGKSMVSIATAGYRGQQGYAVGLSTITDNGKWMIKGGVSGNERGQYMYGISTGYLW